MSREVRAAGVSSGGTYQVSLTATKSYGTSSETLILKVDESPSFTSPASASGVTLSPFAFQVTALGYPVPKFSISGTLPAGVRFSAKGAFSGKPKAGTAGDYPLVITATNSQGTAMQLFDLTIS